MKGMDKREDQWMRLIDFQVGDKTHSTRDLSRKMCYIIEYRAVRVAAVKSVWVKTVNRWQSNNRFTSFLTFLCASQNLSCQYLSELLKPELTATFCNHRHVIWFFVSEHDMHLKECVVSILLHSCENPLCASWSVLSRRHDYIKIRGNNLIGDWVFSTLLKIGYS